MIPLTVPFSKLNEYEQEQIYENGIIQFGIIQFGIKEKTVLWENETFHPYMLSDTVLAGDHFGNSVGITMEDLEIPDDDKNNII